MKEEWKEVYGFNILYEISNLGRVRTKYNSNGVYGKDFIYLEPCDNGNGYLRFNWNTGKKKRTVYVHRLVAEYFISNPNKYIEINHKDENKYNNQVDNLEWCSHRHNCNYGTRNLRASLNRIKKIECIETGQIYTYKEIKNIFGISKTAISNCVNGRSHSAGGYHWRCV